MTNRLVVKINSLPSDPTEDYTPYESIVEELSDAEAAEIIATQTAITEARTTAETARAAIVFGNDADDILDLATRKQIVDNHRKYLRDTANSVDPTVIQTRRLTRVQLSWLKGLD